MTPVGRARQTDVEVNVRKPAGGHAATEFQPRHTPTIHTIYRKHMKIIQDSRCCSWPWPLSARRLGARRRGRTRRPALLAKEQKDWGIAGDAKAVKRTHPGRHERRHALHARPHRRAPGRDRAASCFRNDGKQLHEFVLGTKKELEEHAALMLKFPNMEHDEPYMAHVPAGKTGEIIWTFNRAGRLRLRLPDRRPLPGGHGRQDHVAAK